MFNFMSIGELLVIMTVALIVFGPRRLPEIMRTIGKLFSELKKATDEMKVTIEREIHLEEQTRSTPLTIVPSTQSVSRSTPQPPPPAEPAPGEAAPHSAAAES